VRNNADRHPCADSLIRRIAEIEEYGEPWSLDAGEIRDLLGVSSEEFYRSICAAESRDHPLISLHSASGSYSQDINPQGLRRCQEITAACSLLLSSL